MRTGAPDAARPRARGLRRARRRPRFDPVLPRRRARLRELLALPGSDRARGRRSGGHRFGPVSAQPLPLIVLLARNMIESLDVPAYLTGQDGELLCVNEAAGELTGGA